jgi:hypothetical protein
MATAWAIVGAKTTGAIKENVTHQPLMKPADGKFRMTFKPEDGPPKMIPTDRQEKDFAAFLGEDAQNVMARDEKTLCHSSNQDFLFLFRTADNMLRSSVHNFKGPLGTGVCWWMSDFQFHFLFLTYVNPKAPRPTREAKQAIVQSILQGKSVTELPGYASLAEFMQDPEVQHIIKRQISDKFLVDSFVKMRWANRKPPGNANDMSGEFRRIQTFLNTHKLPAPIYLDLPGPPAHTIFAVKVMEAATFGNVPPFHNILSLDSNAVPTQLSFTPSEAKFRAYMSWGGSVKRDKNNMPILDVLEPKVYLDHPERYHLIKALLDGFCKSKGFKGPAKLQVPKAF